MTAPDLITFLTARLDEAEAWAGQQLWYAEQVTAGPWQAHVGYNHPHSYLRTYGAPELAVFSSHRTSPPLADGEWDRHVYDAELTCGLVNAARGQAENMLRDVQAKRLILNAWRDNELERGETATYTDGLADGLKLAVIYLASAWNDHPDYRPEWGS